MRRFTFSTRVPSHFRKRAAKVILFMGVTFLSACSLFQPPPTSELQDFRNAISVSQSAGESIFSVYEATREETLKNQREDALRNSTPNPAALPYATEFKPREFLAKSGTVDDMEVRRTAFVALTDYADALTALAEGRPEADVKSRMTALGGSLKVFAELADVAKSAVPLVGPIIGLATTAVEAAQNAQSQAQFRSALEKGEKAVTGILDFLVEDTKYYYGARFALVERKSVLLGSGINADVEQVIAIVGDFSASDDDEILPSMQETVDEALKVIRSSAEVDLSALTNAAASPLSNTAQSQLVTLKTQIEQKRGVYTALVVSLNTYETALQSYVTMLDRTKSGFIALRAALDRPLSVEHSFEGILRMAFDVRKQVRIVHAAIEAAR